MRHEDLLRGCRQPVQPLVLISVSRESIDIQYRRPYRDVFTVDVHQAAALTLVYAALVFFRTREPADNQCLLNGRVFDGHLALGHAPCRVPP
jgi:hypothetical protein